MARRMFSTKITQSAKFLKMPNDSQSLYFHLGMAADDDGIVEAYPVLKLTGSNEDNLKVLVAKGFIKILNEDLVSFIVDWQEHNLIRADRKIDSIYKHLLLQIVPDVELLKPKPRADTKVIPRQKKPLDVQWTSTGLHKIREDKISKDNDTLNSLNNIYIDDTSKIPQNFLKKNFGDYRNNENKNKKDNSINEIIYLFKEINPFYKKFFKNKTERQAIQNLLDQIPREKLEQIIKIIPETNLMKYAPVISKPTELENKFISLGAYIQKEQFEKEEYGVLDLRTEEEKGGEESG